jgi:hypothetical protein
MITIETVNDEIYQFNLPTGKEQKLIDIWENHNNKSINFTIDGELVNIKLSDIANCHIGEKTMKHNNPFGDVDSLNELKGFLGIK